ncbi:hypothetical protein ACFXG9_36445 [Streptomyces mirabilis]|uniref:hypothetical protein n=1 Tax=Streptomyces mirabilis TaxID=68239 RepID=UPI0036A3BFB2
MGGIAVRVLRTPPQDGVFADPPPEGGQRPSAVRQDQPQPELAAALIPGADRSREELTRAAATDAG